MDILQFLNYGDAALLLMGVGALLLVLYYYRAIDRLPKSIMPGDRNRLLPFLIVLFLVSYAIFGYRLILDQGIFQGTFASYEDTLSSILFFAAAIFVLYATQTLQKTFSKLNTKFAAMFDNAPLGIHTVDAEGVIDFASPMFLAICGAKNAEDVIGKHISKIPLYGGGVDAILGDAIKAHKRFETELSFAARATDPKSYYHLLVTPMDESSAPTKKHMLVLLEDVTKRKQLEESIKQHNTDLENQRIILENVAENMTVGAILLNTAGEPLFINSTAKKLANCAEAENAKAYPIIVDAFKKIQLDQLIATCLKGSPFKGTEMDINDKVVSLSSTCLTTLGAGQTLGSAFFGHLILLNDITEQRTLDRAKNDFVSIASHEMRTPLTIIRGNASLVREDLKEVANNTELLGMVASIEDGADRLMKIVNDFLDVIRLEGGRIQFKKEAFDLVALVQKVTTDLQGSAAKKNIYLKFKMPESSLPLVDGDKERAEQVVINLVMNAIQYTDQGGIDVEVRQEGASLVFRVSDTGVGIDKGSNPDLFKKFGTSGKTFIHSKEYGSGLGLYICKLLVEAMGGHIELEKSEIGTGSTFMFSLTVAKK